MTKLFQGIFTAVITPFKNGEVDFSAFCDFVEWQINEGVSGLVVCGTTGEAPTLTYDEHKQLIESALATTRGQIPVIAGATSNNTAQAIHLAQNAKNASAILVAPPYYNKPTQEGIYEHYKQIAQAINTPIIIYNIPGRCGVDIANDTMEKILTLPNVVGIKDSTGDLNRLFEIDYKENSLLSGEDSTTLAFNASGGDGCISVTANVAPSMCVAMQNRCFEGDYTAAKEIHKKLFPLHKVLFYETNPIPVKYAVSLIRKNITPEMRLPLTKASPAVQEKIKMVLSKLFI